MYTRQLMAGWGDMDFNAHMRNTAYLDKSADVRMLFFVEHGFPMSEFARLRLGPVVMKDEIEYFRELNLLEAINVELSIDGLSEDGSRLRLCNRVTRPDGVTAATVRSLVGWLDLDRRRLVAPPPALREALQILAEGQQVEVLPSSLKPARGEAQQA